jgi:hypothetical protein
MERRKGASDAGVPDGLCVSCRGLVLRDDEFVGDGHLWDRNYRKRLMKAKEWTECATESTAKQHMSHCPIV